MPEPDAPDSKAIADNVDDVLRDCGLTYEILGDDPPASTVSTNLGKLADRVRANGLSTTDVALLASYAGTELKQAGVVGARQIVATAIGPKEQQADELQGSAFIVADPVPVDYEVDGEELAADLVSTISRFLILPPGGADAFAFWILHTHAFDASEISPILALTSPEKRCGKTTALEIAHGLVRRPMSAANLTPSVLFRTIEKYRPTGLFDEADTYLRESIELRGVLNAGHRKSGAYVWRGVGDDHEPRVFHVYAPKVLAAIGRLPDTLGDRSIELRMRRKRPDETVERIRLDRIEKELDQLRRQAWTWSQAHIDALRTADPEMPAGLHDRARDNWRPLVAIADEIGGEWPDRLRQAIQQLVDDEKDDESAATMLLADVREIFAARGVDALFSATIVMSLVLREDRPWPEWRNAKPLTTRQLAKILRPFGIKPRKIRIGSETKQGYRREALEDSFLRYIPPSDPEQPEQPAEVCTESGFFDPEQMGKCSGSKSGENPHEINNVPVVPDGEPLLEQKEGVETEYERAERAGMGE